MKKHIITFKLWLCTGTSYKIKLCKFNAPNLSDTISTEDIRYPKLSWNGPEAGKIKLNSTPILLANKTKVLLGITRLYSLVTSKENVPASPCGLQGPVKRSSSFYIYFFLQPMGNFLAHYSWNVICFDIKEYEEINKILKIPTKIHMDIFRMAAALIQ